MKMEHRIALIKARKMLAMMIREKSYTRSRARQGYIARDPERRRVLIERYDAQIIALRLAVEVISDKLGVTKFLTPNKKEIQRHPIDQKEVFSFLAEYDLLDGCDPAEGVTARYPKWRKSEKKQEAKDEDGYLDDSWTGLND